MSCTLPIRLMCCPVDKSFPRLTTSSIILIACSETAQVPIALFISVASYCNQTQEIASDPLFLCCCPDCQCCPTDVIQMGQVTIWAVI